MNEAWKQWTGQVAAGRFPLRQYLGGSDHSVVYLTDHIEHYTQKAAIKLIPDHGRAEEQLSRWADIAKLNHPHLLRLLDTGRCELGGAKLLYVVMEFAEEGLAQILPERALRPGEVRVMLAPILSVLQYLHGNRFVHARLRPSNVLAAHDQLKLSSDGLFPLGEIARQGAGRYDPPETGHEPLSPAADVWSLGVTIVEVLTQIPPEPPTHKEPTVPASVPPPFWEIAQNCLRLYPQRRWTLSEIEAALTGAMPKPHPQIRQGGFRSWRYVLPALAVVVVAASLIVPRLGNIGASVPATQPAQPQSSSASATPSELSEPMKVMAKPEAGKGVATALTGRGSSAPAVSPKPVPTATPNTGLAAGSVVHRVIPNVPVSARNTITGKIRVWVRVAVDSSGNVTDTSFDRPGPSRYFARQAKQAAEGWKFTPAQSNGQQVPSEWVLRFQFGRESTEVFPAPAAGPPAKP
jgi:TonB family protein